METKKKIIIAGAGLVGSLLAIALKKRGHEVLVFEKRSDMRRADYVGGKSINLIITAKGMRPLVNLKLWDTVRAITSPVVGRSMHSKTGEETFQPYGKDPSECNYSVSRADLNRLLMTEAEKTGVHITFNSSLVELDLKTRTAHFENSAPLSYDLFYGADGTGSATRQALIRALGDQAEYKVEPLGTDYKELTLPLKNNTWAMNKDALHIWPRGNHMLMGLPNQDGTFTMTLYMPKDWFEKFNTPAALEEYFKTNYPDALALMPDYQAEYQANHQGFLGIVRMRPWVYQDQVALLGDSAHAMVPFFGQGMNSGFSDVQFLLDQMDQHPNDYRTIFEHYNDVQKLSGDAMADMSLENFYEMCDKVGDQHFLLRKKVENKMEQAFPHKFRSRYGLVTYTLIPYHLVKEVGVIQDQVLDDLCQDLKGPDDLDMARAEKLVDEKIVPWFKARQLSSERYNLR